MKGEIEMNIQEALDILRPASNTLESLKQAYKEKSKLYHPDLNGNTEENLEMMKLVNVAYDVLKNLDWTIDEAKEACQNETSIDEVILKKWQQVKTWVNVKCEVIGTWIWVSGGTYNYKAQLKDLGFKWSKNKQSWYWHSEFYRKYSRKKFSMEDIRSMFGSTELENESYALN
jgi:hypothetical protein